MAARGFSLYRTLRSRRLAIWLIVGITVYSGLATLVPQGGPEDTAEWAAANPLAERVSVTLGLHHAFATPWFLMAAMVLALSTIACAWERTGRAWREWRSRGSLSSRQIASLRGSPHAVLRPGGGRGGQEALADAAAALRRRRMRVRAGPALLEGRANDVGLAGSPVFHWALAALFIVIGLGQLTRSEGGMNFVPGQTLPEVHDQYVKVNEGWVFLERHTGLAITVKDIKLNYTVNGVDRGSAPLISLSRGADVLREQRVYPNSPLRYGSLMIHKADRGPRIHATLESTSGEVVDEIDILFRFNDAAPPPGIEPREVTVAGPVFAERYVVRVEPLTGQRISVAWRPAESESLGETQVAGVGDAVDLPEGVRLVPVEFGDWIQLTVVNDWSVPWIYAMFTLASLAVVLPVFLPPRTVWVLRDDSDDGAVLRVRVRARRSDPAFQGRIVRALAEAVGAEPPDEEDDAE